MLLVIQKTLLSIRSAFNFVYNNVVCGMALNLSLLFKDINQEKILVLSDLIVRNYIVSTCVTENRPYAIIIYILTFLSMNVAYE